jgi:hypothetical protein
MWSGIATGGAKAIDPGAGGGRNSGSLAAGKRNSLEAGSDAKTGSGDAIILPRPQSFFLSGVSN